MGNARAIARSFVYIYIAALIAVGASAQELPGRVANTGMTGSSQMTMPQNMFDGTQDVLFGKNTKGPYSLSWKPVDRSSESVTVNGHMAQRGADYQIDYASGILAFTSPVPSGAVIKVEYKFDPKTATRNVSAINIPLTLDLLKRDNRSLQFKALYRQAGADPKQTSDLMILGISGDSKFKSGQLSSMFLFAPEMEGQESKDASFIDRSAMQFGGSTGIGGLKLTTSYSRIGESFAGAKEYKLKPGVEAMDFAAQFAPSDVLNLSASTNRTEQLAGAREGEVTTTNTYAMSYADDGSPKLNASRTEIEKGRADIDSEKTTTDQVKIEHQIGSVNAVASHENIVTQDGEGQSRLTTDQLAIDARVNDNIGVRSSVTQKDSSDTGGDTRMKFDIDANPSKTLSVKAAVMHRKTDADGSDASETLKLTANPSARLNIEMNVAHRDLEGQGSEFGNALKVVSSPLSYLNVQMDWSDRQSQIRGNEQIGRFQLQANPYKMLSVSAAIGLKGTDELQDITREARVDLRPFGHTTISGAYSELESNGTVIARTNDVSASTNPGNFIQLSGGYKQRQKTGEDDLNTMNAAVVLNPSGFIKVTGEFASNPEDKKGVVQRENNQKVGLLTDFGSLRLKGGYTQRDRYLAGKRSEVTEVGVDVKLSAHGLLTTSYKLDENREQSVLATNIYALGYRHQVGSDLDLYIGGTLTTYEENQMYIEGKTQYEAQANLGVRF